MFPIDWPEPFGLVMIEAMSAGTPVIAWRKESVAEVVTHRVSGVTVKESAPMNRAAVRAEFETRFTVERMAAWDQTPLHGADSLGRKASG